MEDNRGKRCTKYQQQDRDDQPRPWLDEKKERKSYEVTKRESHTARG
jgi:hypothetical protein